MKDTNIKSKTEREESVKFALAINAMGRVKPSKEGMELIQSYIDGETTIEENIEKLKDIYRNKQKNKLEEK